ncbi:hypothetical protein [Streptomyces sp. NPDC016845]
MTVTAHVSPHLTVYGLSPGLRATDSGLVVGDGPAAVMKGRTA